LRQRERLSPASDGWESLTHSGILGDLLGVALRFSAAAVASLLACAKGASTALPAEIVYATPEAGLTRLYATPETPGATRTALSPAAERAAFVGALGATPKDAAVPPTRTLQVVYALVADDASLTSLRKIGIDGKPDVALADLPAATWTHPAGAWQTQDGTIVVQLSRRDGSGPSLLAVRDGGASVLAQGRFLAMAGNCIAYLANSTSAVATVGDIRSVGADGNANLALGGGDADDLFHGAAGDELLFTAHHTKTTPELRIAHRRHRRRDPQLDAGRIVRHAVRRAGVDFRPSRPERLPDAPSGPVRCCSRRWRGSS
jgi:hypothetical protein